MLARCFRLVRRLQRCRSGVFGCVGADQRFFLDHELIDAALQYDRRSKTERSSPRTATKMTDTNTIMTHQF